jgi:hypothetical protein
MTPPPTPTNRLPGGQPGNTNALKHGFYARKFKPQHLDDYTRANQVTGLDEEIALLRLVILNLAASCLPAPGAPPDLAACHALEASLARLSHLLKDQRLLALGAADPADLIAALFAPANAGLPFTAIFPPAAPLGEGAGGDAPYPSPLSPILSPLGEGPGGDAPPLVVPRRFSRSSFPLDFSSSRHPPWPFHPWFYPAQPGFAPL